MLDALLSALSGGGALDPMALLQAQLDNQSDPRMAMLLRLIQQRREAAASEQSAEDAIETEAEAAREDQAQRESAAQARQVRDTMQKLYAEVESLRSRNDKLAAALGACFLCFGGDPLCEECGGRGIPGSRAPEPAAYRQYVLPALRRVQRIQSGRTAQGIHNPLPQAQQSAGSSAQAGGA
jgi:hypothetical protein